MKKKYIEKTPEQIAWASKILLKKICEIIKEKQKKGNINLADSYVASLIMKGRGNKDAEANNLN